MKFKVENIDEWLCTVLLLCLIPIFFVWENNLHVVLTLLISIIFLKNINSLNDKKRIIFSILYLLLYLIMAVRGDTLNSAIYTLSLASLFFVKPSFLIEVYEKFVIVFSIIISVSIFFYCLFLLGINLPYQELKLKNTLGGICRLYPFFVLVLDLNNVIMFRFSGYFDEPGVVGTICAVILLSSKLNLKEKKNIPILLAGFLSFSLFFYLILLIYILLFTKTKYKLITIFFVGAAVLILINNEFFNAIMLGRLNFENGSLSGNNRTTIYFDNWYQNYTESINFYFGFGSNYITKNFPECASYKNIVVNQGFLFFSMFIGTFVLYGWSALKFSKEFFIYLLILFSVIYQRPFIEKPIYIFLIYVPIFILKQQRENYKQQNLRLE